jgi:phosphate-selective porin OprO and OprP
MMSSMKNKKMNWHRCAIAAAVIGGQTVTNNPLLADDTTNTINSLKQQIEQLDQKVRILESNRELEKEASTEKAASSTVVTAGASGFTIRSADTNFVLKIRGYVQADARFYPDDNAAGTANDTFLLRRVRPILEGTVFEEYDFRVMLDFGSGASASAANNGFVQDAYLNARFRPEFQVQVGKFKEPVGLERLQSGANLLFVERGYPTQLLPNRDVGVQLQGDLFGGALSYAAGVFNGVADGGSGDFETADDDKDFAGRIFAHPFKNTGISPLKGLGLGVSGTFGNQEGALRTFVSPGQQRFFGYWTGLGTNAATASVVADGEHWRISPQGYYYWGPFGLFGEYAISEQWVRRDDGAATFGRTRNTGWQVAASYILTGEENSWRALTPKKPLNFRNGTWGAWEIAARIGQLDVDDDAFPLFANPANSATEATSWGVGLNWHLNRNVKLNLNYEQTDFKGGATSPLLAKGEKVVLTRVQVAF